MKRITLSYDIAVLKLIDKAPSNNPSIESIDSLAAFWQEGKATVTGWGSTEESGGPSSQLRYVEVDLIDKEKCNDLYGNNLITDTMICTGVLPSGGMDACQGDSDGARRKRSQYHFSWRGFVGVRLCQTELSRGL